MSVGVSTENSNESPGLTESDRRSESQGAKERRLPQWFPRAVVIGLIVVLAAAAAGLGWQVHRNDVVEQARTDAMDAAAQQAVAMLAYDFENVDQQLADAAGGLAGSFREDYTKLVADSIAPAAKERSLTVQVTVQAKSVVDASSDEATVLLYLNQVTTSSDVPDAKTTGSRVTMDLEKTDGRWLVSRLTPV